MCCLIIMSAAIKIQVIKALCKNERCKLRAYRQVESQSSQSEADWQREDNGQEQERCQEVALHCRHKPACQNQS